MLDALEAKHLAQRGAGGGCPSGLPPGCFGGCTASACALHPQQRAPSLSALAPDAPRAAQHAGGSTCTLSASSGPWATVEHGGCQHPRWQQPTQSTQRAIKPGICVRYGLSGFRDAASTDASGPRPSVHQQHPEQLHDSATAPGAEPAQGFVGISGAQQGPPAAATTASRLPSHTSHPPLCRQDASTRQPSRILWEPGGQPQAAAAMLVRPMDKALQRLHGNPHLRQPLAPVGHIRPPQPPQAALLPAQRPACQRETQSALPTGSGLHSYPLQARLSSNAPPAADAPQQHGSMASILPPSMVARLPASSVTAAAEVHLVASSTGDTEKAPASSHKSAQNPSQDQAAAFSIEWDDWQPLEEWPHDPAKPSKPVPGLEDPDADPAHVGHSLGDDVEAARVAGCEPDLTPCKTATKGMQLDRWRPYTPARCPPVPSSSRVA